MNYSEYNFNPYQFTGPDWWMKDFHSRHVNYFKGCRKVLDLGAGRGFFLECLKESGINGVGVESHPESIKVGEEKSLVYARQDIFSFFDSDHGRALAAECDGIYCSHVLEHMDPEEVFLLFKSIKESCAPGVRCRFITNNPADISVLGHVFWGDLTHKRLYPGILLEAMARSQGFTGTRSENFMGLKIGLKDRLRRVRDKLLWGDHKWLPNLMVDFHG
jgi:O-antigen chain-terminating methyltransferase